MVLQLLVAGISVGFIYGLVAMGMVLIFRTVGIMNFAQGDFLMLGGYLAYTFNKMLNLNINISIVLASLCMGIVGVLFMNTSYWPLRGALPKAFIACAMGSSIVLRETAKFTWGSIPLSLQRIKTGSTKFAGASIQWQHVAIIVVALLIMILIYTLLEKTFIGNIMQATAQDQYMSSLTGIPVKVSISLTFIISASITGICGGLLAPIYFLNNTMGTTAGAKAFAAIVIGGFGSIPGAIIGGLIVGLVEQFGGAYISSMYQLVLIYVVLVFFLMFKPSGLFKSKIQEKA